MKTYLKIGLGLLKLAVVAVLITALIAFASQPFGLGSPGLVAFGIFSLLVLASCLLGRQPGVAYGTILEVWANYIIERFFKDNQFLKGRAYDDSQYVVAGRIVHIPQPGSKPAVVKNRNSFPGTAVRRSDTDVVYALDDYSTDPTHIPNIDSIHISYDKQDSVLGDHMYVLDETVADDILIKWASNATVVKTTGGAGGAVTQPVTGQTGTRLAFHHSDLKKLMIRMNADNVPKTDRYCLIDDNMYEGFYDSLSEANAKDFSRYADAENGIIGKLHGFSILTRSSVVALAANDSLKALGAALGSTDNLASLAWQKNSVAYAIGDKKLFQDKDSAIYYGDVHSAILMAGGRVRRADGKGVYVIAQGTPA